LFRKSIVYFIQYIALRLISKPIWLFVLVHLWRKNQISICFWPICCKKLNQLDASKLPIFTKSSWKLRIYLLIWWLFWL